MRKSIASLCIFMVLCGITWTLPTTTMKSSLLQDDLKEVFALLPKDKFQTIADDHLKNDPGFQASIVYFKGEEWKKLVETVKTKPDWVNFKTYLKDMGIDLDSIIKCINEYMEKTEVKADIPKDTKKNLKPFILEISQSIPTVKILAALHDKMIKNPKFQEIYDKLSSNESKILAEKFRNLEEVQRIIEILEGMGINMNESFDMLYSFFGWNRSAVTAKM